MTDGIIATSAPSSLSTESSRKSPLKGGGPCFMNPGQCAQKKCQKKQPSLPDVRVGDGLTCSVSKLLCLPEEITKCNDLSDFRTMYLFVYLLVHELPGPLIHLFGVLLIHVTSGEVFYHTIQLSFNTNEQQPPDWRGDSYGI